MGRFIGGLVCTIMEYTCAGYAMMLLVDWQQTDAIAYWKDMAIKLQPLHSSGFEFLVGMVFVFASAVASLINKNHFERQLHE